MSKAVVLDSKFQKSGEIDLPVSFSEVNSHNLYLYIKSYQAALRSNTAHAKTKAEVRGGGKKPWAQKGRGGARSGSNSSPVWVGGGTAHGPRNNRNYVQKVNKKQKKLALMFAINEKAEAGKLLVLDSISIESGKTKDAAAFVNALGVRDVLVVKEMIDEKSFYAFRNLGNAFLVESNELNGYTTAAFDAIVIEKSVLETLSKEG